MENPVLLFCSERSGSNLLRCLFNAHPDVYAPNTMALGHLCSDYYFQNQGKNPEAWASLAAESAYRINESSFYTGVKVTKAELLGSVVKDDAMGLYLYAYYKGMRNCGANRLVIKEHQPWRLVPFFSSVFRDFKVIVQTRDPMDHAVSCKKLGRLYAAYHGSVPRAAKVWAREQGEAISLRERFGVGRVRFHRYEDLVNDPRATLRDICAFLGFEWQESMLGFHIEQKRTIEQGGNYLHNMWANLDGPVNPRSVGQWQRYLRRYELNSVMRETGSLLSKCGYIKDGNVGICETLADEIYRLSAAVRFWTVTASIWLAWIALRRDLSMPCAVVTGDAVRAHRPYERFRDRLGYQL